MSLKGVELLQVRAKIENFHSIADVNLHHKPQFIPYFSYGFCKCDSSLGIQNKCLYKTSF